MISVIIQAYNRREFLLDAVKSVLEQTLPKNKYEIIVIKNFKDEKIDNFLDENKILNLYSPHKEQGKKILEAIEYSKYNYIALLDDDDLYDTKKLETVYKYIKENKYGYIRHRYKEFIKDPIKDKAIDTKKIKSIEIHEYPYNFGELKNKGAFICSSTIIFRKEILKNYESSFKDITFAPDAFIFLAALNEKVRILLLPHVLTYRRIGFNYGTPYGSFNSYKNKIISLTKEYYKEHIIMYRTFSNVKELAFDFIIDEKANLFLFDDGNFSISYILFQLKFRKILYKSRLLAMLGFKKFIQKKIYLSSRDLLIM